MKRSQVSRAGRYSFHVDAGGRTVRRRDRRARGQQVPEDRGRRLLPRQPPRPAGVPLMCARALALALSALIATAAFGCGSSPDGATDTRSSEARQAARHGQSAGPRRPSPRRRPPPGTAPSPPPGSSSGHPRRAGRTAPGRSRGSRSPPSRRSRSEEAASECDPNYSGCLSPTASDYDCEGGSGDGPEYTGTVSVTGEDHYGLDSDSDGVGCESW